MRLFLPALFAMCFIASAAMGQDVPLDSTVRHVFLPVQKFYVGGGLDGAIFSTATINKTTPASPGTGTASTTNSLGILRFSYFINIGVTFNFNPSRHFGFFTGVDLKNLGFIEDPNGVKIKHRTYNLGVPLGIKIGNMARKGAYIFLGGGVDAPVNYREKSFVIREQKITKFNEWFSDRTPQVMPYAFAGLVIRRGISLKVQYYLNNFLNPDFTKNGYKPYEGYDVHPILFTLGITANHSKKHDVVKKHVAELKTM